MAIIFQREGESEISYVVSHITSKDKPNYLTTKICDQSYDRDDLKMFFALYDQEKIIIVKGDLFNLFEDHPAATIKIQILQQKEDENLSDFTNRTEKLVKNIEQQQIPPNLIISDSTDKRISINLKIIYFIYYNKNYLRI